MDSSATARPSGNPGDLPQNEESSQADIGSIIGDRVISVWTLLVGLGLLVISFTFPDPGQPEDPGTAALPQLIGAGLLILGIMLFFRPEDTIIAPARGARVRTTLMVVAGLAFTLAIEPFGFVLATLIFMVGGLLIMGVRSPLRIVLVPIGVTLAIYYLFTSGLGVYLPGGFIEGILP